jgi:hypothetical protein
MSDRTRHEQLARQRLEERKNRKKQKALSDGDVVKEGDNGLLQEAVLKFLENKHCEEREVLVKLLESEENNLQDLAQSMTSEQREEHVRNLKLKKNALNKGLETNLINYICAGIALSTYIQTSSKGHPLVVQCYYWKKAIFA